MQTLSKLEIARLNADFPEPYLLVKALQNEGATFSEIAQMVGVSKAAVVGWRHQSYEPCWRSYVRLLKIVRS